MTTPFTVTVHGTYTRDEIPPRCRKPRPVQYETTATHTVACVSSEEAPVAFRVTETTGAAWEVRAHAGRLYEPYMPHARQDWPTVPGESQFPAELTLVNHMTGYLLGRASSAEEFQADVSEYFARFLVVDGIVWAKASEPGYLVCTFGLGGINGSTALMVSDRTDHGTLFRADEFEEARAHAFAVAEERGDRSDRYVGEAAERYRAIEVLLPEEVTLVTVPPEPPEVRDLRFEYSLARGRLDHAETPDEETDTFEEVVRLREEIIRRGYAPLASDARPYEARAEREAV